MSSLQQLRDQIDIIDSEILELLAERFTIALETRAYKSQTVDSDREKELEEFWTAESEKLGLSVPFSIEILKKITAESRRLQDEDSTMIA